MSRRRHQGDGICEGLPRQGEYLKAFECSSDRDLLDSSFSPVCDLSGLSGKDIFVTGVLQLARRCPESKQFQSKCDQLDILNLNAGVIAHPPTLTEEGHEILSWNEPHWPLSPHRIAPPHSAELSLAANTVPSYDLITSTRALLGLGWGSRYGWSKAVYVLFAAELARRHPEILSASVHPGAVVTGLYQQSKKAGFFYETSIALMMRFFRSIRTGALTQIWAAGAPREQLVNGRYYVPIAVKGVSWYEGDVEMARAL
ncbi:hypothetical protein BDW66DRAFT_160775 [Aspergillus desertorum]